MALRAEIQQLVDEISGALHPGEPWNLHAHHIAREAFDVVGALLNAGANVDELANEAVEAARLLIPKLNLGAVARRIADTAVAWVIPPLVEQLATFAGPAREFTETQVVPRLDEWIATLQDVRAALVPA